MSKAAHPNCRRVFWSSLDLVGPCGIQKYGGAEY